MNNKKSRSGITRLASEVLRNNNSSKVQRQLAGSVLSQVDPSKQTGAQMEDLASKVLNSNKYSSETKSLAGSVLSQSNKAR